MIVRESRGVVAVDAVEVRAGLHRLARVRGVVEVRGDGELAAREGDALRPSTREEVGGDGRRGVARATEEVAEARELFGVKRAKGALLRGDDVAETIVLGRPRVVERAKGLALRVAVAEVGLRSATGVPTFASGGRVGRRDGAPRARDG